MLLSELENCEYICVCMIYWFPIMEGKDKIEEERELVQEVQMPDTMKMCNITGGDRFRILGKKSFIL